MCVRRGHRRRPPKRNRRQDPGPPKPPRWLFGKTDGGRPIPPGGWLKHLWRQRQLDLDRDYRLLGFMVEAMEDPSRSVRSRLAAAKIIMLVLDPNRPMDRQTRRYVEWAKSQGFSAFDDILKLQGR